MNDDFTNHFLKPIYEAFIKDQINKGLIEEPPRVEKDVFECEWVPMFPISPLKDHPVSKIHFKKP